MASLREGWRIQVRVIHAVMLRELTTRFGRENIGFLWIMAEPLLFGGLVSIMWYFMKGPEEHGVSIAAFVVSGYLPLTLFRHAVTRSVRLFEANGSLMYHRQIKITDFVFVRFLIEMMGTMMAYLFVGLLLYYFDLFPIPADVGLFLMGWLQYSLFTLALCFVIAPLSEMADSLEKFIPVTTYIMIPFSGTFNMMSWLAPGAQQVMEWSPPVNAMEMMRGGIFGPSIHPIYNFSVAPTASVVILTIGLYLCRRIRKTLVIE
jgi:capsular polysaccharide transport system permease protein